MKMKGSSYFFLVLVLLGIVLIYVTFRLTGLTQVQTTYARLLPMIMSIGLAVFAALGLFVELRKRATEEGPAGEEETGERRAEAKREMETIAWVIGYLVLIYIIGFVLGSFLWVGAYFKAHNHGWITTIGWGLVSAMLLYLCFDFLLGVDLYEGVFYIPLYAYLP